MHQRLYKIINVIALGLTLALGLARPISAQSTVDGAGYNLMLKTLLSHSVPEITVDSLAQIVADVQLIDAREREEYEVSHIAGALFTGYESFDSTIVSSLDKDSPIIVYCSIGYRSEKIAERLRNAGFDNVSNLYGGIFEWVNAGHEVVDAKGRTEEVHAYSRTWGVWLKEGEKVYGPAKD